MEKVLLVSAAQKSQTIFEVEESLEELKSLVSTAGGVVVESVYQFRDSLNTATLVGKGKLQEIKEKIVSEEIDLVVFDNPLSPSQSRNIDEILDCKVIDRTQLILDIFALHAVAKEGKLQIELAQLEYILPRIMGSREDLSRLGAGIGTRGPGESKLEVTRRTIRKRIALLKERLKKTEQQRHQQRSRRVNKNTFIVSIVGYTNSGKTTLLRSLSKDMNIIPKDELFATLSPVSRKVYLGDGKQAVFNDTVGFIRKLPHTIIESFKATLEEISFSDLIISVIDGADESWKEKTSASETVLKNIGFDEIPRFNVINKIDLISDSELELLKATNADYSFVSAAKGIGLEELKEKILNFLLKEKK